MRIPVKHDRGGYDIILERGALIKATEYLPQNCRTLVVTDSGVPAQYARAAAAAADCAGVVTLPAGEATKSLDSYRALLSRMAEASLTRADCVIAVGGGVVGDLSGFAAATYMRGIGFYNIPTTLLSQVDSSIGGKVAVDMDGIKNIVGAFYQPRAVVIDPDVLATLDRRQFAAGLCEAIKMAATSDAELFGLIEASDDINSDIDRVIRGALMIKRAVVEADPEERGLRRVLNFGHTVGHAIEGMMGGEWLHGECVAAGMLPMCGDAVRERLRRVLKKYGLPTGLPAGTDAERLCDFMRHDKKAAHDGINVVTVDKIGSFEFVKMTPEEIAGRAETV